MSTDASRARVASTRSLALVAVAMLAAAACEKKKGSAAGTGSATPGSAAAAPAPKAQEPRPTLAATPPPITPNMLMADEPTWSVEALPRGIYTRSGAGPIEHKCRMDLAMVLAKNGQQRAAAKKAATEGTTATVCEPKGTLTVCTYTDPTSDPAVNPDAVVHWVFTGNGDAPVLIAVMTGVIDDWDAVAEKVSTVEPCPRPSDDPK